MVVRFSAGLLAWIVVSNVQHLTGSHSSAKFLRLHQLPGSLKGWTCWKLHRCRAESEPRELVLDQRYDKMKPVLPRFVALRESMISVIGCYILHMKHHCACNPAVMPNPGFTNSSRRQHSMTAKGNTGAIDANRKRTIRPSLARCRSMTSMHG